MPLLVHRLEASPNPSQTSVRGLPATEHPLVRRPCESIPRLSHCLFRDTYLPTRAARSGFLARQPCDTRQRLVRYRSARRGLRHTFVPTRIALPNVLARQPCDTKLLLVRRPLAERAPSHTCRPAMPTLTRLLAQQPCETMPQPERH